MKKWVYWVVSIAEFIVLAGFSAIILIAKASWLWILGAFLFFLIADGVGLGLLFYFSRKINLSQADKDPSDVIEKIKEIMLNDKDNPDNFIVKRTFPYSVGERGTLPIKILRIEGKGSEIEDKIDWLVNLSSEKFELGRIDNKSEEFVKAKILEMAGYPEADILEEKQTSYDELNRPITKIISKRLSPIQKAEKEEEHKLREENEL